MEFDVKRKGGNYLELTVSDSYYKVTTDWLDEKEAKLIGMDMFATAQDLMSEEAFKKLIVENYSKEDLLEMYEEEE